MFNLCHIYICSVSVKCLISIRCMFDLWPLYIQSLSVVCLIRVHCSYESMSVVFYLCHSYVWSMSALHLICVSCTFDLCRPYVWSMSVGRLISVGRTFDLCQPYVWSPSDDLVNILSTLLPLYCCAALPNRPVGLWHGGKCNETLHVVNSLIMFSIQEMESALSPRGE